MKKKLFSVFTALALCLALLPTVSFAASGATLYVGNDGQPYQYVSQAIAAANDGDTIMIIGESVFFQSGADQAKGRPYIIDKAVTIQSEENTTLIANTSGIVLSADVSIRDLNLSYVAYVEVNGIFANGHTLTIANMGDGNQNHHPVRIFAGGLYKDGAWLGAPGVHGTVDLSGSKTVVGGVFACGLSAPGSAESSWTKLCTVMVTDQVTITPDWTVAGINAGVLRKIMNTFPGEKSADGSLKYARSVYAADEPAEIILNNTASMEIDGAGGAGKNAAVTIHSGQYQASPSLHNISSLTVGSGTVAPRTLNEGCDIAVASGSMLILSDVMPTGKTFAVRDFSGGGILQIPCESALTIRGAVTGQTEFRTDKLAGRNHSGMVTAGHIYIQSPAGTHPDAFCLKNPYPTQLGMQLVKDAAGNWRAENAPAKETDISITGLSFKDFFEPTAGSDFVYEFTPVYTTADGEKYEDFCVGFWYGGKESDGNGDTLDDVLLDGYAYRLELVLTIPKGENGKAYCFRPDFVLPEGFQLVEAIPAAGCYTISIEKSVSFLPQKPDPDPDIGGDPGDGDDPKPDTGVDASKIYTDVSADAWYLPAVSFVTEKGWMVGSGSGRFAPNDNLTRAMLTQILYNRAGKPGAGSGTFTDLQSGAWYVDAVTWAAEQGIVLGYPGGQFKPDNKITREQLAVILYRHAGSPAAPNLALDFKDADAVSAWASDAISWAVEAGILRGKGNGILDPAGSATRGETAQMLMNFFQKKSLR